MKKLPPRLSKSFEPKVQKAVVESLDSDRAADIVEEMEPDAAADLLADLPEERTAEILVQMQPEERQEVSELLEFKENTAAGRMTTEYIALPVTATANDAIEAMRKFEGRMESMSTIFLVDSHGTLSGAVPLAKIVLAPLADAPAGAVAGAAHLLRGRCERKRIRRVVRQVQPADPAGDRRNNHLTGVITPDDVINMLRAKL